MTLTEERSRNEKMGSVAEVVLRVQKAFMEGRQRTRRMKKILPTSTVNISMVVKTNALLQMNRKNHLNLNSVGGSVYSYTNTTKHNTTHHSPT